ncbi:transposable element Tcb2 transposase [Trichonephila clavipes]|nr:transposable element Tcb2 transposase [Trichonephila clavipes]
MRAPPQLGRSDCIDCIVRRCWDQWIQELLFTRRPDSGRPRQTTRRKDRPIGSRCPLRELPLTPTNRRLRLQWCRAQENWTAMEWNQVVFSDESRFNHSSDNNRVRV